MIVCTSPGCGHALRSHGEDLVCPRCGRHFQLADMGEFALLLLSYYDPTPHELWEKERACVA